MIDTSCARALDRRGLGSTASRSPADQRRWAERSPLARRLVTPLTSGGDGVAPGDAGVPPGAAFRHNRAHADNDRARTPDIAAFQHNRVHADNDRAPMPDIAAFHHDL
jgi:hypothetical protein